MVLLFGVFLVVNVYSFLLMYRDKNAARKGEWRISERKLFAFAVCFGSVGILLGMQVFRHKTKHLSFVIGVPLILLAQIAFVFYVSTFMNY